MGVNTSKRKEPKSTSNDLVRKAGFWLSIFNVLIQYLRYTLCRLLFHSQKTLYSTKNLSKKKKSLNLKLNENFYIMILNYNAWQRAQTGYKIHSLVLKQNVIFKVVDNLSYFQKIRPSSYIILLSSSLLLFWIQNSI